MLLQRINNQPPMIQMLMEHLLFNQLEETNMLNLSQTTLDNNNID